MWGFGPWEGGEKVMGREESQQISTHFDEIPKGQCIP